MKKVFSHIIMAGLVLLGMTSCLKEKVAVFEPAAGDAPVLVATNITDDGIVAEFTPGTFATGFNEKVPVNHSLALVQVKDQVVSKTLTSKVNGNKITVSRTDLCKALISLGCAENEIVPIKLAVRVSVQSPSQDTGINGYKDSQSLIEINNFEIWLPTGDPYLRYTEKSDWGLVGTFNSWGGDPDYEMWTNGSLHVAKGITLVAGDQVKFRKDSSWDVNLGYGAGVTTYALGTEFALSEGGENIVILEDGRYDFILDVEGKTATIINSLAEVSDPYAAYTEVSTWSVIGSFNSWAGDVEMVTNGTLHVAKSVSLKEGDEFKFRKDAGWDVNYGYADGVDTYTLGTEFAAAQGGGNIKILADGDYDLILDPAGAKIKIIKTVAVSDDPYAAYKEVSTWSVIGSFNSWAGDVEMKTNGTLHVAIAIALNEGDEWKFRKDAGWDVNFGYADGVSTYALGEEFAVGQDGNNIKVLESGVYDFILDPDNAKAKIIKTLSKDAGDTPAPKPKPKAWSLIGTIDGSNWDKDFDLTNAYGDTWVIKNVYLGTDTEFKLRGDHDWGTNYGGGDPNAYSANAMFVNGGGYDVYKPELGKAFKAGSTNIMVGVAGFYTVTFTYGTDPTILVEKFKEYPENLYMIGEEFGAWNWESDGVVEMTPVLHHPDWGADAEAQFWTVRYFKAGKGFKFNSEKHWGGDFWGLANNDGFTEAGGNCTVDKDGFYLVHVDFKNEKVHVEPARVTIVGDCTGLGEDAWNTEKVEAVEANVFKADGTALKLTLPAAGNLRIYAASAIATSPAWTREFNIYDGKITYRGAGGDLANVAVKKGQVVTLDPNAGTGSITGDGEAPAYKTQISVPGNYSGSAWDLGTAPKLMGIKADGIYKGALDMYKAGEATSVEFKFGHDGSWISGQAGDGLAYALYEGDNMSIEEGTYWWSVDLVNKTASAVKIDKVALIGSFNGWSGDTEIELAFDKTNLVYTGSVELEANAEIKVRFNGSWDYSLAGTLDRLDATAPGNIVVANAGSYMATLNLNAGTLTLTPVS